MINCENCIYFRSMMQDSEKGIGKCIRHTPKSGDVQLGGYWPFVYYDQVCGEFVSSVNGNNYISSYLSEEEDEYSR